VLVVHHALPVKSVKDLPVLARAKPGALGFPSAGNGTSSHLAGELLKNLAKIDMLHVPCKGGGAALADLLGGQVQFMFATTPAETPRAVIDRMHAEMVKILAAPDMREKLVAQGFEPVGNSSAIPLSGLASGFRYQ
jgi:tripartite-type tricarboxylate transporter receptor subunit TctC